MLFRESPHNYRRISSSGLNLTYEGLLRPRRSLSQSITL
jgi:hypothetical protein